MTLQIEDVENVNEIINLRQPNLTYKLSENSISTKIDDKLECIKQSIYHILMTERYSSPIYDKDYGVELEQYINQDFGYILAGIENTLSDALLQDDRIQKIEVIDVSKSEKQKNACVVTFTVFTIYGDFEEELIV